MRRRTFLAGLGFAALQLAGCAAKLQTTPDYVLTYADNQPAGYPTTQGAQYFADLVQQQTGGKVVIQVKANGEYGSEQQVWEQLAIGGVDFARVSLSVATDDLPRLNVLLLPYLYRDADHMWRVLDGSIGAEFLQDFTAQGRVGLSWYDAGARSFYARQPVRSLNDLQGKTIRVQDSQIVIDMIRLLGAVPETTAYSDVYSALETGQIDAAENNWPAYYSMEHYKVARYYMADEHSRVPEVQLASGRTWDALPEEYRQTLQACARASAQYERQLWAQEETAARKAALGRRLHRTAAARRRNAELPATGAAAIPEILCRLSAAGGRDTGRVTTEKKGSQPRSPTSWTPAVPPPGVRYHRRAAGNAGTLFLHAHSAEQQTSQTRRSGLFAISK